VENQGGIISTPDSSNIALRQAYQQSSGSKAGETGEGNEFFLAKYLFLYFEDFLTCRKILRYGAGGFIYPPKEGILRIFIACKNQSPSAGFEALNLRSNIKHANH
jgi:hypothetical protein